MNIFYCEVVFAIPIDIAYTYSIPENLYKNNLVGHRVVVNFGNQKEKVGIIISTSKKISDNKNIKNITKILDTTPLFQPWQIQLAKNLAKQYLVSIGEVLFHFFPFDTELCVNKAIIQEKQKKYNFFIDENVKNILEIKKQPILIKNTSIKEKFEFYKNVILYSLNETKNCLIVFPERFYIEDFYQYLIETKVEIANKILTYTGDVSINDRYNIWNIVQNSFINIILSTKIGVFLPFKFETIVVVDEQDNLGHKNFSNPQFSTIEVLNKIKKFYKIFYSSFLHSINTKYKYKKIYFLNHQNILTKKIIFVQQYNLKHILKKEIYRLKQSVVVHPQKGYNKFISCKKCSKIMRCTNCNSIMKYDNEQNQFKCSLCSNKISEFICRYCKSKSYSGYGFGIQRMSNYLTYHLPEAKVARLDNDLSQDLKIKIVQDFNSQKVDILVVTQEILNYIYRINFKNVSLIYFSNLDTMLYHPNYLAYENCYKFIYLLNLLTPNNSNTILELYKKDDNYNLLTFNEKKFYINELKTRQDLCYPPYCELIQITFVADRKEHLPKIDNIIKELNTIKNILVFSTYEIKQTKTIFKFSILIKIIEKNFSTNNFLSILKSYKNKNIKLYIDYDPKDFL